MRDESGNEIPNWSAQDCVDILDNLIDGEDMQDDFASLLLPVKSLILRLTGKLSDTQVVRVNNSIDVFDEIIIEWGTEDATQLVVNVGVGAVYETEVFQISPDGFKVSDILHDLANRMED